jgi:hypothetical protein
VNPLSLPVGFRSTWWRLRALAVLTVESGAADARFVVGDDHLLFINSSFSLTIS